MKPTYFEAKLWEILANHFHGFGNGLSDISDEDIDKAAREIDDLALRESCGCL